MPSPQKLVVIGGTVETARRASVSAWNGFVDCVSHKPLRDSVGTHVLFSLFSHSAL